MGQSRNTRDVRCLRVLNEGCREAKVTNLLQRLSRSKSLSGKHFIEMCRIEASKLKGWMFTVISYWKSEAITNGSIKF